MAAARCSRRTMAAVRAVAEGRTRTSGSPMTIAARSCLGTVLTSYLATQKTRTAHTTGSAAATYSKNDWAAGMEDSAVVAEMVAEVVDFRHTSGTDVGSRTTHSSPRRRPANWLRRRMTHTRCSWPLPASEAKRSSWACLALSTHALKEPRSHPATSRGQAVTMRGACQKFCQKSALRRPWGAGHRSLWCSSKPHTVVVGLGRRSHSSKSRIGTLG